MPRTVSRAVLCVAVALAAACASSPPSRFYTLSSHGVAGAARRGDVEALRGRRPRVGSCHRRPAADRRQHRPEPGDDRRVQPLGARRLRTISRGWSPRTWSSLLGTPRVSQFQQSLTADGDYRVAIEVQTFESAPGDAATLNAAWLVRRARDGKSETGRTTVREPDRRKSFDALAAAHSRALSRMSQDIADAVRALDRAP